MEMEKIIAANLGTIVDVRTYEEFCGGSVAGSINIPLNEIPARMEELKALKAPLILCCASGMRSGQAQNFTCIKTIGHRMLQWRFLAKRKLLQIK